LRTGPIMNNGGPMAPTTFAVLGSGRRCRFFLRLAAAAPDRLRAAGVVSRAAEQARRRPSGEARRERGTNDRAQEEQDGALKGLRAAGAQRRQSNTERGHEVTAEWGVPAFPTLDELLTGERPDFVAAAVPWAQMPDAARAAVALGVPVLVETPPAPDLDGLRALWADVGSCRWRSSTC
jgi:predicted dehydrogenase